MEYFCYLRCSDQCHSLETLAFLPDLNWLMESPSDQTHLTMQMVLNSCNCLGKFLTNLHAQLKATLSIQLKVLKRHTSGILVPRLFSAKSVNWCSFILLEMLIAHIAFLHCASIPIMSLVDN